MTMPNNNNFDWEWWARLMMSLVISSDQSLAVNSKQISDQRMVISIGGQSSLSLCSIFLISHLKTIWPSQTTKTQTKIHKQDLWSLFLVRSSSTPRVCKNQTTKLWPTHGDLYLWQGGRLCAQHLLDLAPENDSTMPNKKTKTKIQEQDSSG